MAPMSTPIKPVYLSDARLDSGETNAALYARLVG